jgi:coenzyme F420-reducing hydrogenase alpha subunit
MKLGVGDREIRVDYLARVEGEGGLEVRLSDGQVLRLQLNIFEPPRLFEAFLEGRSYQELPDMTARICGICPVAYQMSSIHAAEDAFGLRVEGQLRKLRRLIYCGEWIESHLLHVYLLALPDFLGYPDAFAMAADYPGVVRQGLRMKRLGNDLVALLGGREIHPVSAAVGGFCRVPTESDLRPLLDPLKRAREQAIEATAWVGKLPLPDLTRDIEFVALSHPNEYAMNEGRLVSSKGLDVAVREFESHIEARQLPYSTAIHYTMRGRGPYFVGPLARVNLNFRQLTPAALQAAGESGIKFPNSNPFTSIVARMVEVVHAFDEAAQIIEEYERPEPLLRVEPRAGTGFGLTEAPRGSLYHSYRFDEGGIVRWANIVPPTAQNQEQVEADLRAYIPRLLDLSKEEATLRCEMAVRNYDPCISCSVH